MRHLFLLSLLLSFPAAGAIVPGGFVIQTDGTNSFWTNYTISASGSNMVPAGKLYASGLNYTNLNAAVALTNLAGTFIPANFLTNYGDSFSAHWTGRLKNAAAGTNQFQMVYGSTTCLDTGLQTASNCNFNAQCRLTRLGNQSIHFDGRFEWGPGGGVPFAFTNVNIEIAETNGVATFLNLRGAARSLGAHTNNSFQVLYEPTSR